MGLAEQEPKSSGALDWNPGEHSSKIYKKDMWLTVISDHEDDYCISIH